MVKSMNKKIIYFAFIWHGFFLALTMSLMDFNTVFPALVNSLSESKILFGALYSILLGVPFIFNMIFSHFLKTRPYKKKYLIIGIYLRSLSLLGMGIMTYYFSINNPSLTVISFFIWIFLFSVSAGFAGISYSDIIAKTLVSKERTKLYTIKQFFASSAAFIGGLVIAKIFSSNSLIYPNNYSLSLLIGFIGLSIASIGFYFLKEPKSIINEDLKNDKLISHIKKTPSILKKDKSFKKFIIMENLTSFHVMLIPFYFYFAKETFNLDSDFIGIYLIIQISGTILSNIVWGIIGSKNSAKSIVKLCITIGALTPILALLLSNTNSYIFGLIFFIVGFLISGRKIGFEPYLLDITLEEKRIEYLGIRGSLNILTVILPLIGGILIDVLEYKIVFIFVSIVMFSAVFLLKGADLKRCE